MMDILLRDYQEECIKLILDAYRRDPHGQELVVLPTGAGKTVIFCQVIAALAKEGKNALIIAHRDELLQQAAEKYRLVKPDAVIGKVGAGMHEYGGEVTVASIATISRPEHIKRLRAIDYGLIIIDETHHAMAESYQRVLSALPDAFVLGVTATPDRLDKKALFGGKEPLYQATIEDMIQAGYLCDLKAIAVKTDISLDGIKTTAGDYNEQELDRAVNTPERNRLIVEKYQEHAQRKRAVAFCVTVAHATALATAFNNASIPAEVITGETPLPERAKIYTAFRAGTVRVLCNVMVLTEGWDEPLCEVAIMARPTQSRALYTQQVGRILRLAPAKPYALVLDITDNCYRLRLTPQRIQRALALDIEDGETVTEAIAKKEEKQATARRALIRKLNEKRDKDQEINLFALPEWQERDNGMFVLEVGLEKHRIALVPVSVGSLGQLYEVWARLAPRFAGQKWMGAQPLDYALQFAEKRARQLLAEPASTKLLDKTASWRALPISTGQIKMLKWYRIPYHMGMTRGEASDLIDAHQEELAEKKAKKEARRQARLEQEA